MKMRKRLLTGACVLFIWSGLEAQQPADRSPIHTDKQNLLSYFDDSNQPHAIRTKVD